MKKMDYIVSVVFVVAMVVMFFLGTCNWDIWVLILGIVVAGIVMITWMRQNKKYQDLEEELENVENV